MIDGDDSLGSVLPGELFEPFYSFRDKLGAKLFVLVQPHNPSGKSVHIGRLDKQRRVAGQRPLVTLRATTHYPQSPTVR